MPASRKRNKGKERREKQLVKKEENNRAAAHRFWRSICSSNQCDHGCALVPDGHPVSTFMDQFIINLQYKRLVLSQTLCEIFKSHGHIWTDEHHRKLAIGVLVRIGTNMLVTFKDEEDYNTWLLCFAISIVVLEQYNGSTDYIDLVMNERVVASKGRDLSINASSIGRDFLKFFRKRTTCKCLKKMHLEAKKTLPKMGLCWYCDEEMERVSLSVCSRCMIRQFCSRECHIAAWPEHKEDCDLYVYAHKHTNTVRNERD